ncbi:MAG: hypothetical protein AAGA80_12635 [Cyanobacteria bacterium P01_F01_bin.143]
MINITPREEEVLENQDLSLREEVFIDDDEILENQVMEEIDEPQE